jgi:hypothetical protein
VSTFARRSYPCPTCGEAATRSVVVSLNGGKRPDLREEVLRGTFQLFRCEACGEPYRVQDPFVYVDFGRKEWLTVFPPDRERQWPALESEPVEDWRQAMIVHAAPAARRMSAGMRIRAVFGIDALREKLLCFAHGVDDGWLEVLKLDRMRSDPSLGFHPGVRPRLVEVEADELVFARGSDVFALPRAALAEIQAEAVEWSTALEAVTRGAYVDVGRILLAPRA